MYESDFVARLYSRAIWLADRRELTDAIQELIEYAEAQGSTNSREHAYENYTVMINTAVSHSPRVRTSERDWMDDAGRSLVGQCESMAAAMIRHGMARRLPYKVVYDRTKCYVYGFLQLEPDFMSPKKKPRKRAA
jgi:hypothetical protein